MPTQKRIVPCSVSGQHINGFWQLTFNTSFERHEDSPKNKAITLSFDADALDELQSMVQKGVNWLNDEGAQAKDHKEWEQTPKYMEMVKRQDERDKAFKNIQDNATVGESRQCRPR